MKTELWKVRNFHQGFEHGFFAGMIHTGLQMATGRPRLAKSISQRAGLCTHAAAERALRRQPLVTRTACFDGKLTFDKLTDVYHFRRRP